METQNAKQILSDLYGLMMEINFHRDGEEIINELKEHPDQQVENHLLRIKQISAKLKAEANRQRFLKAKEHLLLLKEKSIDEIKRLISPQERIEFVTLFQKFEDLTKEDEEAILEDQEFLKFLEIFNNHHENDS